MKKEKKRLQEKSHREKIDAYELCKNEVEDI